MARTVTFRESRPVDAPLLFRLFAENKAEEFAPLGLGAAQLDPLLRMQYSARSAGYNEAFPAAVQNIVLDAAGNAVGHVLWNEDENGIRIVDLAIDGSERGRGLGAAVLDTFQDCAAVKHKPLRLQVASASPARRLYERLGFETNAQNMVACEMVWYRESMAGVGTA